MDNQVEEFINKLKLAAAEEELRRQESAVAEAPAPSRSVYAAPVAEPVPVQNMQPVPSQPVYQAPVQQPSAPVPPPAAPNPYSAPRRPYTPPAQTGYSAPVPQRPPVSGYGDEED